MADLDVLGWDNGFGQEKLFTVVNSKKYKEEPLKPEEVSMGLTKEEKMQGIKKARFPSVHTIISADSPMSNSFANDFSLEKMNIVYNGTEYFLGEFAIRQDMNGGIKNFNPNKFKEETEIAKLGAGIALLFPDAGKITIKNLIIGTSIGAYNKTNIKEAIETYKNNTFKFTYPKLATSGDIRKKDLIVEINNVDVLPQGYGGVQDVVFDINGRLIEDAFVLNSRYGIIDVGNNTVDGFIYEGIDTPIENTQFFLEYGTSDLYKNVASKMSMPNYHNQIELLHTQGKDSIYYRGENRSFKELITSELKRFAEEIYSRSLQVRWNRYLNTTQAIILMGGCANIIKDYLEEKFKPVPIIVPVDPQFANARGYYKYGLFSLLGE